MSVDTRKVADRRELHFNTVEDILADLDDISRKKVRALGNWTPGQVYRHLATTMNSSIDGFGFTAPWPFRMIGKLIMKKRLMNKPMSPGFKLPANAAKVLEPAPTGDDEGLATLRSALHRLQTESKRARSPFLGELTREEWNRMHCRHAELHLSFLTPEL
ncbi:MAG: DUF1569 domain-containing protein [Gemmataceae bacterium]